VTRFGPKTLSMLPVVVAATLLVSGCGATTERPGSDASGSANCTPGAATEAAPPKPVELSTSTNADAAAKLPAAVKSKGTLTIATDPTYPPNEFKFGNSPDVIGMDMDMGNAIAKVLGLKVSVLEISFDGILSSVQSGRADIGMSSLTDTKDREQTVDFVNYFKAGTSTMVRKCNPKGIKINLDLCGRKVGAENGSTQLDSMDPAKESDPGSLVKTCKDAGKQPPTSQGFPKQTDVNSALQADRIDAYLADTPVVDFALAQNAAAFEKVGGDEGVAPYGVAVPKNAGTLKDAIQAAIKQLKSDGSYDKILKNWGIPGGGITDVTINGAQS
jgi:polar amino acid transport system substrate-binding protein